MIGHEPNSHAGFILTRRKVTAASRGGSIVDVYVRRYCPARSRPQVAAALHKPRAVAFSSSTGACWHRRRDDSRAGARAGQVPRDLAQQPRRVLRDPRCGPQAAPGAGLAAPGPDGMDVDDQLQAIHRAVRSAGRRPVRACSTTRCCPRSTPQESACCVPPTGLPSSSEWVAAYFANEVEPVLTPLGLDPARPFPRIQNKSLNFIVELDGTGRLWSHGDPRHRAGAALAAARSSAACRSVGGRDRPDLTSQVIQSYVEQLFTGMEVRGCYQFRVTRNSRPVRRRRGNRRPDARACEGELAPRRYGDAVRLETRGRLRADTCCDYLLERFELARGGPLPRSTARST